jgi:hypothetical protein
MGHTNTPITIHDTAYALTREALKPAMDKVTILKPPRPLFPWVKVTGLPIGTKKDVHPTRRSALPTFINTPQNLAQSIRDARCYKVC